MKRLVHLSLFAAVLLGVVMQTRLVRADTGPKPSMEFQLSFESGVSASAIVSGILFECNEADCSDAAPLEELGPQGLYCEPDSCRAIGYGFAPYQILELEFSDGVTRRSNIFEQAGFDSYYTVYVRPQDLFVEPRSSSPWNPFVEPGSSSNAFPTWAILLVTCACALILLVAIAGLVVFLRRRARA